MPSLAIGPKGAAPRGRPSPVDGPPQRPRMDNYKSCSDNNAAGVDFDSIIALGFCEGPLHYLTRIQTVPACKPGDALGKIDLTDAFFCWATALWDCNSQGFHRPFTKKYYRSRYVMLGHHQASAL
eukprot:jgi/Tetstr1/441723/TSEL_029946.t1